MTVATESHIGNSVGSSSTAGASDLDGFMRQACKVALDHFKEPFTNKTPQDLVQEEILQVAGECQCKNWDGYGARPVSKVAVLGVQKFASLIDGLPVPEVTPHPDGELALDWYGEGDAVFSISFGEEGNVSYAGRFGGGNVIHGREKVNSLNIDFIESLVRRTFKSK